MQTLAPGTPPLALSCSVEMRVLHSQKQHPHHQRAPRWSSVIFTEGEFNLFLIEKGISPEHNAPYDPQQGGRHESPIGILWEHTLACLKAAPHIDVKYWPFILNTVVFIRNNLWHSATLMIPSMAWKGEAEDLGQLRVIGSTVYVWQPKELRKAFDSKSRPYIYLGRKSRAAHFVLDPDMDTVYERGQIIHSVELFDNV
ncbi:Integrase catalytic domain-containing protein [Pycnococcus provasolii]